MNPLMMYCKFIVFSHYTRSQKRTYQNATAKKKMTNVMNNRSNI